MPKNPLINTSAPPTLSVVIPFYNELAVLPVLLQRLEETLRTQDITYELVFVDDGSCDGGADFLQQQTHCNAQIRLLKLSRNFGKEAALSAGLNAAQGEAVIVLDADLQDPPELIPEMIAAWRAGAQVVTMKRRRRDGESWFKRATAHVFYRLLQRLSPVPIPEDTGDFRLMSRCVVDAVNALPERNRYMKGLFAWVGFRVLVLEYDREARAQGKTKWQYSKLLGLAVEAITSFSIAPLRWAVLLGCFAAATGLLFGTLIVIKALLFGNPVAGYPSIIAVLTFLGGIQLLFTGIVGEYVGKIYNEAKQRPIYIVAEQLEVPPQKLQTDYSNIHYVTRP